MSSVSTLEQTKVKEPDLPVMLNELRQAQSDATSYYNRMEHARTWWRSEWKGQTTDGRKHSEEMGEVFPWDNAYDMRTRVVQTIIREAVYYSLFVFWKAKIQAKSIRPLASGRQRNVTQRALEWRLYTHMQEELMRELPLYFGWRWGYGCALLWIEWEMQRVVKNLEITLPIIDDMLTGGGQNSAMPELMDVFHLGGREDQAIQLIQSLSSSVTRPEARRIVKDLTEIGFAQLPVAYPYINKPKWTALRPAIDVLFPSQESNIQAARFISLRELVTEAELTDRIQTRGYSPDFVTEAVKHKGEFADWMQQTQWKYTASDSDRDMIELHHFHYKNISEREAPRVYKTVFNEATVGQHKLYATHGLLEYDHCRYPCMVGRKSFEHRPILSSHGIAEEAYTDEINIKCQLDGLANRTDIVLAPPLIVPTTRVDAIKGTFGPREILGVNRPGEMNWMPLPPMDNTPIEVIRLVEERLDRRYPFFDTKHPELAQVFRETVARELCNEIEVAVEMTLQIMQQFEMDDEITKVAGTLQRPFHMDASEIQGQHEITATIDVKMLDQNYVDDKLQHLQALMPFKESQFMFKLALEAVEPDAADAIQQDQMSPDAIEREKRQVREDVSQMMNGIEPPMPMTANHQLQLSTIGELMQQPSLMQRLQQNPDAMAMLKNRVKFHQKQIQQYTQNPQIGRALSTKTFQRQQAPELAYSGAQ